MQSVAPDQLVDMAAPFNRAARRNCRITAYAQFEFHDRAPFIGTDVGTMTLPVTGCHLRFDPLLPLGRAGFRAGAGRIFRAAGGGEQD